MTPSITAVRMSGARQRAELPLLVLGPAPSTSARDRWAACAAHLADAFDVLAWDLPGLGHNLGGPDGPFTTAQLAAGVLAVVDDVLVERAQPGGVFAYAGDSGGLTVGRQLQVDVPDRVRPDQVVELDSGTPDPGTAPQEVARLIRRQLLGEDATEVGLSGHGKGLDERERSLVSLAAMVVQRRHGELAAELQSALGHGVTIDDFDDLVEQLVDQVDDTATARRIAQAVFGR